MTTPALPPRIIFFDGVCVLCNGVVAWLLKVDENKRFAFAPLQGPTASACQEKFEAFPRSLESIVYIADSQVYVRSDAALRIASELPYPYRALSWFRWLPRALRDAVYRLIARVRYGVFGRREACMVPSKEQRSRFLD